MRSRFRKVRRILGRKWRNRSSTIISILFVLIFCFSIALVGYNILFSMSEFNHMVARTVLQWGMPAIHEDVYEHVDWRYTARSVLFMLTDFDLGNPKTFIEGTTPILSSIQRQSSWEERSFVFFGESHGDLEFGPEPKRPEPTREQGRAGAPGAITEQRSGPQVLIYHTHTSEMYLGPSARAANGLRAAHYVFRSSSDAAITGVMQVGRHLSDTLNNLGIANIHESRIHDFPSLAYSYSNSERTVRELLNRYEDIQFVLDIHRDALIPEPTVVINGRAVARVLLVVGTAQDIPMNHPHWDENLEFARRLYETAESLYPGLMRPTQIRRDARYNQHLHPGSIIMEIGSVENTIEEASLAAELIADVLATLTK